MKSGNLSLSALMQLVERETVEPCTKSQFHKSEKFTLSDLE